MGIHPTRRGALTALGAAAWLGVTPRRGAAAVPDDVLSEAAVLRDASVPVGGNPDGDIGLVEWFDYQCPYCRKLAPDLDKLTRDDGKLRQVFKDWPILGPESMVAAQFVLAARFQDKYLVAHRALIETTGRLTDAGIRERLAAAGVDVERASRDIASRGEEIKSVLVRNDAQAKAFGFEATPSFIVGKFRVPGILTIEQFRMAIADARKAAKSAAPPGRPPARL